MKNKTELYTMGAILSSILTVCDWEESNEIYCTVMAKWMKKDSKSMKRILNFISDEIDYVLTIDG